MTAYTPGHYPSCLDEIDDHLGAIAEDCNRRKEMDNWLKSNNISLNEILSAPDPEDYGLESGSSQFMVLSRVREMRAMEELEEKYPGLELKMDDRWDFNIAFLIDMPMHEGALAMLDIHATFEKYKVDVNTP